MNKFFTALAAAVIATTGVYADTEYKMTVTLTNGETVKYPVRNIESITFEEGVAPVNFASILEADYYGDKYDSNAGYFTLALTNIANAEQNLFEALNIEGFTTLDADGKAVLAPGTYTYEFNEEYTGSPMTFLSFHQVTGAAGTYYMSTLNGTDNIEWFNVYGGTITVDRADDIYTINATLLNANNEERQFSYTGAIEFTDHTTRISRTINIDLSEAVAQYAGKYVGTQTEQMYITLTGMTMSATEMAMNQCALLLYTDSDSEIPEGTYTMAGDYDKVPFTAQRGFILGSPSPTYVYVASQITGEAFYTIDQEGTIKVTKNGNNYTLDIDFVGTSLTTGELVRITSTFNGPISIK